MWHWKYSALSDSISSTKKTKLIKSDQYKTATCIKLKQEVSKMNGWWDSGTSGENQYSFSFTQPFSKYIKLLELQMKNSFSVN